MKKKGILAISSAVASALAICGVAAVMHEQVASEVLFYDNVDALSRSESTGSYIMCSKTGNDGTYWMSSCTRCGNMDHYAMDIVAFCK